MVLAPLADLVERFGCERAETEPERADELPRVCADTGTAVATAMLDGEAAETT